MNNPSEAYYQLRYDFTLHYLFVVYENLPDAYIAK